MLNVNLEVVVDGFSYKFDYGQTTFIDKSQRLDKFLSSVTSTTVTPPIPGTSAMRKNGSLSSRLGSPLVAILVDTVMHVLRWRRRDGYLFIVKRARISSMIMDILLLLTHIRVLRNLARYIRTLMATIT